MANHSWLDQNTSNFTSSPDRGKAHLQMLGLFNILLIFNLSPSFFGVRNHIAKKSVASQPRGGEKSS